VNLQEGLLQQILRLPAVSCQRRQIGEERRGERGVERLERRHRSRLIRGHMHGELPQGFPSGLSGFVHFITLLCLPAGQ